MDVKDIQVANETKCANGQITKIGARRGCEADFLFAI